MEDFLNKLLARISHTGRGETGDTVRCRSWSMRRIDLHPAPAVSPVSLPCQRRECEKCGLELSNLAQADVFGEE